MLEPIPLARLPRGAVSRVVHVRGVPDHVHRLEEMGLHAGVEIEMVRPGPACIVRSGGVKLGLREDDRLRVFVEPGGLLVR